MQCCTKSLSHVRLFATPRTVLHQAPLSMGFSRQEYWSGLPFPIPGDLPDPRIEPMSSSWTHDSSPLTPWTSARVRYCLHSLALKRPHSRREFLKSCLFFSPSRGPVKSGCQYICASPWGAFRHSNRSEESQQCPIFGQSYRWMSAVTPHILLCSSNLMTYTHPT